MVGKNSIPEIKTVLLDVRKAFRLLYIYQRRVMDIMQFIGHQTLRKYEGGWSKFSNSSPKDGKGKLDLWAWDWLNMYCYEFYFGKKVINENSIQLSVWLVSDTGFYDADDKDKTNVDSFSSVEDSATKLVFVIGKNLWHEEIENFETNLKKLENEYAKIDENRILITKSFDLSLFVNADETRKCLHEIVAFCKAKGIFEMTILN
jgi:hypothetical protein